jgi:hypothetical protein
VARIVAAPVRTSSTTADDERVVRSRWFSVWLPTGWAVAMARVEGGVLADEVTG